MDILMLLWAIFMAAAFTIAALYQHIRPEHGFLFFGSIPACLVTFIVTGIMAATLALILLKELRSAWL